MLMLLVENLLSKFGKHMRITVMSVVEVSLHLTQMFVSFVQRVNTTPGGGVSCL